MLWGHTAASDLKGLGSFGCPYPPYSTKNRLQEKMNQGLHTSLFTQSHKSISGEAFKINSSTNTVTSFLLLTTPSPTSNSRAHTHTCMHTTYYGGLTLHHRTHPHTHTHMHLLWGFHACGAWLERGTPSSEHTLLTPTSNCSTTALPNRRDFPRNNAYLSSYSDSRNIFYGSLTPSPKQPLQTVR